MGLITYEYFLSRRLQASADFPATIHDSILVDAELIMRTIAGAAYNTALLINLKEEETRTAEETLQLIAFKNAECEILFGLLLSDLNIRLSQQGLIQSSFTANFGSGTFRIATPNELMAMIKIYADRARQLISLYLPKTSGILPAFASFED